MHYESLHDGDQAGACVEWLCVEVVQKVHEEQASRFGGLSGVRDMGLLESALHRPLHLTLYGAPDIAALTAAYAFGIVASHPFTDGNKRCALIASELFLHANGWKLCASDDQCVEAFVRLAAGEITESAMAEWFRAYVRYGTLQ